VAGSEKVAASFGNYNSALHRERNRAFDRQVFTPREAEIEVQNYMWPG
jgi:hypothetical protein